jgi:hypothetical protein
MMMTAVSETVAALVMSDVVSIVVVWPDVVAGRLAVI